MTLTWAPSGSVWASGRLNRDLITHLGDRRSDGARGETQSNRCAVGSTMRPAPRLDADAW